MWCTTRRKISINLRRQKRRLVVAAFFTVLVAFSTSLAEDMPALNRDAVLGHLNAVITWYRDATTRVQATGLPSDAIYEDTTRNLAAEAVRLAFQSARAEAALIEANEKTPNANQAPKPPAQKQNLSQVAAQIAAEIDDIQTRLDQVNKQLASAPASKRKALLAQRERLQGELSLDKAVQDAVQKMAAFAEDSTDTGEGLEGSINQLARSVPEVFADKAVSKATAKPTSAPSPLANSSGLIGQALTLLGRMRSVHDIDQMIKETEHLRQDAENLRKPLRDTLLAIVQRGRDLANQSDTPENTGAAGPRRQYQDLITKFKQLSSASMPLSQETLLLEQSRATYIEWRRSIVRESTDTLRSVLVRVIGIALALGIVAILSEVWRKLTFRYIREPRRRRQFLLLRRFVMYFLVGVVLITGFVSEFSSLATFAGFVTAGIAVGLQAVLLSVAAYFFVVGRYGIRVGDRISIAGVTGDVVDIGLVRLYIMELAGVGVDLDPTGRIVVFSNSVLFQAGTPLFKQIPGTEYAWHELAATLAPGGNYKLVQDKISNAVNFVYEQYRERIERQLAGIERQTEIQLKSPKPESKLQLSDTGVEFVVRYPVDIRTASEIDDHLTRAVVELVNSDPELKNAIAGTPKIRAAVRG
ncbi:MAG: MscS family mechanosensitive ion channel [Candidatus Acidoferrum typicum]|nr:MscS family mechanosensitive ion channel [Candidatus Acidoferrum typicum]